MLHTKIKPLAIACAAALFTLGTAHAETQIKVGTTTYSDFSSGVAAGGSALTSGTAVWLNADNLASNTDLRATQRSLGFREVDYKAAFSAALNFTQVAATTVGANTVYDYSAQSNKATDLVGFWQSKDLPIIIGPDGKAYITDGHHTTAGYLAAVTPLTREMVAGQGHVVLGHVVANYYNPAAPAAPTDAWWAARQSENNALLYVPGGNQLTKPTDPGYAGLQPVMPSVLPMPTVPGKTSMTNDDMRSVTWGMADGITAGNKGYSKTNSLSPLAVQPDVNFVEFYWADFLRNRVTFDNSKSGSALGSGKADANLISAPTSFFAAVANGTALAKSEVYKDQYGRSLNDYANAADLTNSANTLTWAGASIKNGLAKSTGQYNMYLLDDSTVQGDITPSAKSTNKLHIDTTTGQIIGGKIQNFSSVDINKGSSIAVTWKDAALQSQNSTVSVAAGTGKVVFANANNYTGTTNIGAGTLEVSNTGSIDNSSQVTVDAGATLINNGTIGGGGVTVSGAVRGNGVFNTLTAIENSGTLALTDPSMLTFTQGLTFKDGSLLDIVLGTQSSLIRVSGGFLTGSAAHGIGLHLNLGSGFQVGTSYMLIDGTGASLSSFDATDFFLTNTPIGETAMFSVANNQLLMTLAPVPEPETYAMLLAGLGLLGLAAKRRQRKLNA
jgi:autotransporter-associated beta strand protein